MKDGKYEVVSGQISPDGKRKNYIDIGWFALSGGKITEITPTLVHAGKTPTLSELLRQYGNHAYYEIRPLTT